MKSVPSDSYAAVDLGSNSFHMIVANYSDDNLQIVDRLKEMIRLASGLDSNNILSEESMKRAIHCLQRFGQRAREIPRGNIRVVGTNTLRQAHNGEAFLRKAQQALGLPIEIIAGQEEARLVYLGVSNTVYNKKDKRLVIDIGGGSTEVVIGRGFEPMHMESLYMGCVNTSQRFFPEGEINAKRMHKAILFARQELESIEASYTKVGWDTAIGSSGTILSINDVIKNNNWGEDGITSDSLDILKNKLIESGKTETLDFEGLSEARKPVFAGGVAILFGIFEALEIEQLTISDGALREGLIHDLIGRTRDQDIRDRSIENLMQRYNIETEQANRVNHTAGQLFNNVKEQWGLSKKPDLKILRWAANVHEIGLSIAHAQYHKHGAYLLSNSDLPGFSRQEQMSLAALVRSHRRKFPDNEVVFLQDKGFLKLKRLSILLRLAVLLNRSRSYSAFPEFKINIKDNSMDLQFPDDWLSNHPLTQEDLKIEKNYLSTTGFTLNYS